MPGTDNTQQERDLIEGLKRPPGDAHNPYPEMHACVALSHAVHKDDHEPVQNEDRDACENFLLRIKFRLRRFTRLTRFTEAQFSL